MLFTVFAFLDNRIGPTTLIVARKGPGRGQGERRAMHIEPRRIVGTHRRPRFGAAIAPESIALDGPVLADLIEREIEARSARNQVFGRDLVRNPAWALLLELARTEIRGDEPGLSAMFSSAGVAQSTGLRYLRLLTERGYVRREPDPRDRRRSLILPTAKAMGAVSRCLREMHMARSGL